MQKDASREWRQTNQRRIREYNREHRPAISRRAYYKRVLGADFVQTAELLHQLKRRINEKQHPNK
jgi:hypothetical protein